MNNLNLQKGSWAYTKDLTDEQYELLIELMVEAGASDSYCEGVSYKNEWKVILWDWNHIINHISHPRSVNLEVTSSQLQVILDERKLQEDLMNDSLADSEYFSPPTKLLSDVMELKALNDQMNALSKRRVELEKSICDDLEIC